MFGAWWVYQRVRVNLWESCRAWVGLDLHDSYAWELLQWNSDPEVYCSLTPETVLQRVSLVWVGLLGQTLWVQERFRAERTWLATVLNVLTVWRTQTNGLVWQSCIWWSAKRYLLSMATVCAASSNQLLPSSSEWTDAGHAQSQSAKCGTQLCTVRSYDIQKDKHNPLQHAGHAEEHSLQWRLGMKQIEVRSRKYYSIYIMEDIQKRQEIWYCAGSATHSS